MDSQQLQLPLIPTCLSPSVHSLITELTSSADRDPRVVDTEPLLDFAYICSKLPAPIEANSFTGSLEEYFLCCVKALSPMFHSVEDCMEQKRNDDLCCNYQDLLAWTGQDQVPVILEVLEMMYENEAVTDMLVLLVMSAVLERSLGNVYLTRGPQPCPSMLKDLLVTQELQAILGQNVIQVLRVIIGPPMSLNLRNVAWHGFPFPREVPRRCIWFIICLLPSIGKVLHENSVTVMLHREPLQLPKMKTVSDVNLLDSSGSWLKLLCNSELVNWKCGAFWEKIVHLYRIDRLSFCAALLLYYLEHGLRRVFATVNNCHHRVLTAEATSLFTTFDEILGPFLPDGSENVICHVLGTPVMEILMDLLMYQEGPRLRDRLSHGELHWIGPSIPREIVDSLLVITIHISAMFIPQEKHSKIEVLEKISKDISNYSVQFHRITLVHNNAQENADIAQGVDDLISILPDLSKRDPGTLYPMSDGHMVIETDIRKVVSIVTQSWSVFTVDGDVINSLTYRGCDKYSALLRTMLSHKIFTLYREAKLQKGIVDPGQTDREGELVSVLHHILKECNCVLSHVSSFANTRQQQLENKELRSRQRENLKKFLTCFPSCVLVTNVCSLVVVWQLYHLESQNTHHDSFMKSRIKFWKVLLQFCENLRTYTNPDKNKWTDGLDLIVKFTKSLPDSFETNIMSNCPN